MFMWDSTLKSRDTCINYSITFKVFLTSDFSRKHKILDCFNTLIFRNHFLFFHVTMVYVSNFMENSSANKSEKRWYNVIQSIHTILLSKDNKAAVVFSPFVSKP